MESVLLIVIIVIVNLASYKMAERRGRNVWAWLAFSVLLSPLLAWIALAIMGKTKEKQAEELSELKNLIKD